MSSVPSASRANFAYPYASSTVTLSCDPTCPVGFHCAAAGCVADSVTTVDMPASVPDLAMGCSPACSGATPLCNDTGVCVPCLVDTDCSVGQVCQVTGRERDARE